MNESIPIKNEVAKLAKALHEAKQHEVDARNIRIHLEERQSAYLEIKPEGSATTKVGDYKVTTTSRMNRVVDQDAAARLREKYGKDIFAIFPVKYSVSAKEIKALANMTVSKDIVPYRDEVLQAVTTKPGKLAVKVEETE